MKLGFACASALMLTVMSSTAETKVLQAFEGDGFDDWKVEGEAFVSAFKDKQEKKRPAPELVKPD